MDINFYVNSDNLTSDIKQPISGNVNFYKCVFTFSEEWNELATYAIFSKGGKNYTIEIKEKSCFIPKEVLEESGYITIGVFGTNGNENNYMRISSNAVTVYVGTGAYKDGETPQAPTPDVWEEIKESLNNLSDTYATKENVMMNYGIVSGEENNKPVYWMLDGDTIIFKDKEGIAIPNFWSYVAMYDMNGNELSNTYATKADITEINEKAETFATKDELNNAVGGIDLSGCIQYEDETNIEYMRGHDPGVYSSASGGVYFKPAYYKYSTDVIIASSVTSVNLHDPNGVFKITTQQICIGGANSIKVRTGVGYNAFDYNLKNTTITWGEWDEYAKQKSINGINSEINSMNEIIWNLHEICDDTLATKDEVTALSSEVAETYATKDEVSDAFGEFATKSELYQLGAEKENQINKCETVSLGGTHAQYPTVLAVANYVKEMTDGLAKKSDMGISMEMVSLGNKYYLSQGSAYYIYNGSKVKMYDYDGNQMTDIDGNTISNSKAFLFVMPANYADRNLGLYRNLAGWKTTLGAFESANVDTHENKPCYFELVSGGPAMVYKLKFSE